MGAEAQGGMLRPILELLRRQPRRVLGITLLGCLSSAGSAPSLQFVSELLQAGG